MAQIMDFLNAPRKRSKNWKLNERENTLTCKHYEIYLDRCTTSAGVLDWIFQVKTKTWATPEVLHDLILALDDYLHVQGNYCSFWEDQGVKTKDEVRGMVRKSAQYIRGERESFL